MKEKKNTFISGVLYILLIVLLVKSGGAIYRYYKSPTNTVQRYLGYIEKGNYSKAYQLIAEDTLDTVVGKEQLMSYYTELYKGLMEAQCIERVKVENDMKASCMVSYEYQNKNTEEVLELVKNEGKWQIVSPFKSEEITIYTPSNTKLYLDGKALIAQGQNCYKVEGLLPGSYMLEAKFSNTDYKDYYELIHIPAQKEIIIPYETVDVQITTIKGLEVSLGDMTQMATRNKVDFSDMLPGTYRLKIESPYHVIEPLEKEVSIGELSSQMNCTDFKLSEVGETCKKNFVDGFYKDYLKSIKEGEVVGIETYFKEDKREEMLDLFEAWFIDNKSIKSANLKVESDLKHINSKGYLQGDLTEIVELTNEEVDEEGSQVEQVYRVILKWNTQIDITQNKWEIVDRTLSESIVAYKDFEDRWVQY